MIQSEESFAKLLEMEISEHLYETNQENTIDVRRRIFTEKVCEYLVEYGVSDDVTVCRLDMKFGRGKIVADGYAIKESTGKITIVSSIYQDDSMQNVPRKEVENCFQRAVRLVEAAYAGFNETEVVVGGEANDMIHALSEFMVNAIDVDILILANGVVASEAKDVTIPEVNAKFTLHVWDMVRLSRCAASGKSYESIVINLEDNPLVCLRMSKSASDEYEAMLAIISGESLHNWYDTYGSKLLELNVRSFLQATGKVNRGIRDTLRTEPSRFFAYNKGISANVESYEGEFDKCGLLKLTSLTGFQVVNGGQTMASIHRACKKDKSDLSNVFVQAKITVVKPALVEEVVPQISRYSNTQNRVNEADFSSNDPFHIEIERLSEKNWCPGQESRWFYDRARGQYQVARVKYGTTPKRLKNFERQTPRTNKFDKGLLAKYINTWDQLPHVVSLGTQKNFVHFMSQIAKQGPEWMPDEVYYKKLIGIAIMVKVAEKAARQYKFPSYRSQSVAYTLALISYRTQARVDLLKIWQQQVVSDALLNTINKWIPLVRETIIETAGERNVGEWCKKPDCWHAVQVMQIDLPDALQEELSTGQPLPTVGKTSGKAGDGLSHLDRENIAKTMQLSGDEWMNIHIWANMNDKAPAWKGISLTLAGYAANNWQNVPSAAQAKSAVKMISEAKEVAILEEPSLDVE
jgi:hypothetical protein